MDPRLVVAAVAVVATVGCRQPKTDIIATDTEDVGPYQVAMTVDGRDLTGRVCVANARHADEIARRINEQLKNHTEMTERSSPCSPIASP